MTTFNSTATLANTDFLDSRCEADTEWPMRDCTEVDGSPGAYDERPDVGVSGLKYRVVHKAHSHRSQIGGWHNQALGMP